MKEPSFISPLIFYPFDNQRRSKQNTTLNIFNTTQQIKLLEFEMEKYTVPKIPSTQYILEDLSEMDNEQINSKPPVLQDGHEAVQNAHICYQNFRQLQADLLEQDNLNSKLEELNKKLVENIANIKK